MTFPIAAVPAFSRLDAVDLGAITDGLNLVGQPPTAVLRQTSAQSLTSGAGAAILLDAEDLDTHGGHSTSSNTSRYTAQLAGWYQFSGGVCVGAGSAVGRRACWWTKNGSSVNGSEATMSAGDDTQPLTVPARTIMISLAVADYVELFGFQDSGGSISTGVTGAQQPSMHVRWVRPL